jgi:hypothetical protein
MSLFQESIIRKHLGYLDPEVVDQAYLRFKEVYSTNKISNIKVAKEEQYQEGFIKDIFGAVLGYSVFPEQPFNIQTEKKNEANSKKADGAIMHGENVVGVIELKDNKTKNLDAVKDQAFGYKNNHKDCSYVISSNFHKLRFYLDDATDYEEFDLYNLDKETFKRFYLYLRKEGLLDKNIPKLLRQETKFHEENITKSLYKDYSSFKNSFFQNVLKNNPQHDKLLLFKKSQKFLDKVLFVLFAEDKGLVATNSIVQIVEKWQNLKNDAFDTPKPLYELVALFFNNLFIGKKDQKGGILIPEFGGEIFAPDEVLDTLLVDDDVLKDDLLKLSKYDFNTDVDVNILGHIFEHSLSEIEEVEAELKGEVADKTKGKRKKDGVFYTPKYITKYIVENTVGKLCAEKKAALNLDIDIAIFENQKTDGKLNAKGVELYETLNQYKDWLLTLKILDPACGSGAFLNQAVNTLVQEHTFVDDIIAELTNTPLRLFDTDLAILENNIYGVDINEESIEIAKLSLWLRTAKQGRKLSNLSNNIKCGNSLIDDPAVAGDKAFNWQKEFPEVFANGGFDVVIGNPPYLRIQGLKEAYPSLIKFYQDKFLASTGNYDIYVLFLEKSNELINNNGLVSFILPHKFLIADFGIGIREYLRNNKSIEQIVHFGSELVFRDATTYTCIISLSKQNKSTFSFANIIPASLFDNFSITNLRYDTLTNDQWILSNDKIGSVLGKLSKHPFLLKDVFERFVQGIITGKDEVYCLSGNIIEDYLKVNTKRGDFLIEKSILKPHLRGEDLSRYKSLENKEWLLFPYKIIYGKAILYSQSEMLENFPKAFNYLEQFKEELSQRENQKYNNEFWYQYSRNQAISVLEQPKIITPEVCFGGNMTIDLKNFYHNSKCHTLLLKENSNYTLNSILPLLNSKVFWFYLSSTGNVLRGGYIGLKRKALESFPIPNILHSDIILLEGKTIIMLQLYSELQEQSQKFQRSLARKFALTELPKKLQEWYLLSYAEFIKELAKKKIKLSLNEEAEWETYFTSEAKKALELKAQITQTDKEIDQMVYALYELTEDEIKIVEGS